MAHTKVKLNHGEFRRLLTGPEVTADLGGRAQDVAAAAGDGYTADQNSERRERAGYTVYPSTPAALRAEAKDHGLLGALDAGQ